MAIVKHDDAMDRLDAGDLCGERRVIGRVKIAQALCYVDLRRTFAFFPDRQTIEISFGHEPVVFWPG